MLPPNYLIIVNGNSQIGYGHISRTLTIADYLKRKKRDVHFLIEQDCPFKKEIEDCGYEILEVNSFQSESLSNEIRSLPSLSQIEIGIIDLIEKEYEKFRFLKDVFPNIFLVSITLFRFSLAHRFEHLSFFPDFSEDKLTEVVKVDKFPFVLYEGKSYILFRDEFEKMKNPIRKNANRILVTMGGADPKEITAQVLTAIGDFDVKIDVIISKVSKGYGDVIRKWGNLKNINFIQETSRISELMVSADVIVLNGGLTRYEACITQTPFIAISIHEQQYQITQKLTKLGTGINLGVYSKLSKEKIRHTTLGLLNNLEQRLGYSQNMGQVFDLGGKNRIVNLIQKHYLEFKN